MAGLITQYHLDDTHVADEGEEVEEGGLDAVMEVATAAGAAPGGAAGLVSYIGLVQAEEESVVHVSLGHSARHAQGGRSCRGQVAVVEPVMRKE